jgi:hypothetical protein
LGWHAPGPTDTAGHYYLKPAKDGNENVKGPQPVFELPGDTFNMNEVATYLKMKGYKGVPLPEAAQGVPSLEKQRLAKEEGDKAIDRENRLGGRRRKTRRSKKRRASRRAKKHTRRSRS